jgi:hypothetical protein
VTDTYPVGDTVLIDWAMTDVDGDPVTGATVAGTVTLPDDTTAALTAPETSTPGTYRAEYVTTAAGRHSWRLTASGTGSGVRDGSFDVRPAPDPSGITTDPSTALGRVRLLIPDLDAEHLLFVDDQLAAFLDLEGDNVRRAAACALETLASNEAMVSKVIRTQDLSTDGVKVAAELRARAAHLRALADRADDEADGDGSGFGIVEFPPCRSAELAEDVWC